ncbi:hypothetical protein [Alkalibaculum sporogenes]|nr:hypothetical protein [Alkalibaculum sporogenes]
MKVKIYEFNFLDSTGYVEIKNGKVRIKEMSREICPEATSFLLIW